jgi:hypothetical protein
MAGKNKNKKTPIARLLKTVRPLLKDAMFCGLLALLATLWGLVALVCFVVHFTGRGLSWLFYSLLASLEGASIGNITPDNVINLLTWVYLPASLLLTWLIGVHYETLTALLAVLFCLTGHVHLILNKNVFRRSSATKQTKTFSNVQEAVLELLRFLRDDIPGIWFRGVPLATLLLCALHRSRIVPWEHPYYWLDMAVVLAIIFLMIIHAWFLYFHFYRSGGSRSEEVFDPFCTAYGCFLLTFMAQLWAGLRPGIFLELVFELLPRIM